MCCPGAAGMQDRTVIVPEVALQAESRAAPAPGPVAYRLLRRPTERAVAV